jgi:hypothetical protein
MSRVKSSIRFLIRFNPYSQTCQRVESRGSYPERQEPLGLALTNCEYGLNGSNGLNEEGKTLRFHCHLSSRGRKDNRSLTGNGRGGASLQLLQFPSKEVRLSMRTAPSPSTGPIDKSSRPFVSGSVASSKLLMPGSRRSTGTATAGRAGINNLGDTKKTDTGGRQRKKLRGAGTANA